MQILNKTKPLEKISENIKLCNESKVKLNPK